jgi:hypothetical protein
MSSRALKLLVFLSKNGNHATLGQIQKAFIGTTVAYSMTQCVSEARDILRKNGYPYTIVCFKASIPSMNRYMMVKVDKKHLRH